MWGFQLSLHISIIWSFENTKSGFYLRPNCQNLRWHKSSQGECTTQPGRTIGLMHWMAASQSTGCPSWPHTPFNCQDKFLNLCLIGMRLPQDLCALEAVCTCVHAHTHIWFSWPQNILSKPETNCYYDEKPSQNVWLGQHNPLPPGGTAPRWDPVARQLPGTSSQLDTGPAFL